MASSPPSSPSRPSKKPKVSTSDADEAKGPPAATSAGEPRRRYKRRKVAIFLGYCGAGYQGMQKNPGARTIEDDLEEALFLAGAVPEADRGLPRRYDWARSARTDKGVSAAAQVVSGRFYVDPPGLVARLNSHLADKIRVFGFKRVTNSFNAKKFCDRRRYVYLLPVFALDASAHSVQEAIVPSMGSDNELASCLECSERGWKVPALLGRQCGGFNEDEKSDIGADELDGETDGETCFSSAKSSTGDGDETSKMNKLERFDLGSVGDSDNATTANTNPDTLVESMASTLDKCSKPSNEDAAMGEKSTMETGVLVGEQSEESNAEEVTEKSKFSFGDEQRERFNRILEHFVGTHNFHNFTTRTKAEDPSARRYIISFNANSVVCIEGIEFVKCEVVGQSFMLHQIRKMIGLAVAVMRNCAPESLMEVALRKDVNINVPTAPEVGLYLDECLFTSYNKKWKDSHEALTMGAYAEEAEEFKMKYIYSHIASVEHKEGAVAIWLHYLSGRNYPDFRYMETNSESADAGKARVSNLGE